MTVCVSGDDYRFRSCTDMSYLEQPVVDDMAEESTSSSCFERECVLRLRALVQDEDPALDAELETLHAALLAAVDDRGQTSRVLPVPRSISRPRWPLSACRPLRACSGKGWLPLRS